MFIPPKKHIKYFSGTNWINSYTFYGMSEENVINITKSNSLFAQINIHDNQQMSCITSHKI